MKESWAGRLILGLVVLRAGMPGGRGGREQGGPAGGERQVVARSWVKRMRYRKGLSRGATV